MATPLGLSFSRIRFTPDMLPADVTGTHVFDERDRSFEFNEEPVFANVVLADEINRAPPETQSALLEAIGERQATAEGETCPVHAVLLPGPVRSDKKANVVPGWVRAACAEFSRPAATAPRR